MNSKKSAHLLSLLAFTAASVSALSVEAASYNLDITRNGITHEMVVYDFWSGEYPGPVVAIGKTDKGSTVIKGSTSLRNPTNDAACAVSNGLYHPWAAKTKTDYEIYSVIGNTVYTATKDLEVVHHVQPDTDENPILKMSAGQKLSRSVYLGEGFCQYVVGDSQKEIQTDCASVSDNADFAVTELPAHKTEQWIKFECKKGASIYVNVEELLKQKGVTEGQIESYGSVTR